MACDVKLSVRSTSAAERDRADLLVMSGFMAPRIFLSSFCFPESVCPDGLEPISDPDNLSRLELVPMTRSLSTASPASSTQFHILELSAWKCLNSLF